MFCEVQTDKAVVVNDDAILAKIFVYPKVRVVHEKDEHSLFATRLGGLGSH